MEKTFQFLRILEKFGFPLFIWGEIRKLGGTWRMFPFIGDLANTFAHLSGPSRVFQGHRFCRSKIPKSKLQKTPKVQKTPECEQ